MKRIMIGLLFVLLASPALAQNSPFTGTSDDWGGKSYQFRTSSDRLNDATIAILVEKIENGYFSRDGFRKRFDHRTYVNFDDINVDTLNQNYATSIGNQQVTTNNCSGSHLNCSGGGTQTNQDSAQVANAASVTADNTGDDVVDDDVIDVDIDVDNDGYGGIY